MAPDLPSRRCRVIDPENAVDEIRAFLEDTPAGQRAWCEVVFPPPIHLTPEEKAKWEARQLDAFDAVELIDGELVTLPPYAVLAGDEPPHSAPIGDLS